MSKNKVFKTGDTIYLANAVWSGDVTDCPVCSGQGIVLVKPFGGSDEQGQKHRCGYCDPRGEGKGGKVTDTWSYQPQVRSIQIEGIETKDIGGKITHRYLYNISGGGHNSIDHSNERIFDSYGAAMEQAKIFAEQASLEGTIKKAEIKIKEDRVTWGVGYNKKQIREQKKLLQESQEQLKELQFKIDDHIRRIQYSEKQLCITK